MNISNLRYPPIKSPRLKKLPDKLIYHAYSGYFGSKIDNFIMFSTKPSEKNKICLMMCFPEMIFREGKNVPSLYIQKLISSSKGLGFGTAMLNFAKRYSKSLGCGGRFHLLSSSAYLPQKSPHVFYKKFGLNTGKPMIDKKLDKFVRKGKNSTYRDFEDITMYYPAIKSKSFLQKFFDVLFNRK